MSQDGPCVWVTGAGGLIGHQLVRLAPSVVPEFRVQSLTRSELDLADREAVVRRFHAEQPRLVVHCAGLTRSPACDADPELARQLNTESTAQLSDLAAEAGAVLVFFSSDLVFDGHQGHYTEADEPRPLSAYGRSKRDGERAVLRHPRHLVIRTSLNYGRSPTGDRAFNEEMVAAARRGGTLRLFTDEYRCPIGAEVTARATWELAQAALPDDPAGRAAGVFHVAGSERLSRYAIGELVAEAHPELAGHLMPVSRREYTGPPRPADTSMVCSRAQACLRFALPAFSTWLRARRDSPGEG